MCGNFISILGDDPHITVTFSPRLDGALKSGAVVEIGDGHPEELQKLKICRQLHRVIQVGSGIKISVISKISP